MFFGVFVDDFNISEPEEGRLNVRHQTFTDCPFPSPFPHVLEIAQPNFLRKDTAADGTVRTLSRIDRALINLPMTEARDFHFYSHVSDNLGERSTPSDHVAVRVVKQKPTIRSDQVKRIQSWMSKQPVFCTSLKKIGDDHQIPTNPFAALADFKVILEKAREPDSSGTSAQHTRQPRSQALDCLDCFTETDTWAH